MRKATASAFGPIKLHWEEHPFEWIEPRSYSVRRSFRNGLVEEIVTGMRLSSEGESTKIELYTDAVSHNPIGRLLLRQKLHKGSADFLAVSRRLDEELQRGSDEPFGREANVRLHGSELERIHRLIKERVDAGALARLVSHIRTGFDEELVQMRPFELADRWHLDRMAALRAFLHSARAGLLDLEWTILCPNCRVPKSESAKLHDLKTKVHCDTCRMDFRSDFDRSIEARFTVSPSVRSVRNDVHCIGGPGFTPHRLAQLRVPEHGPRTIEIDLPARRLFLRPLTGSGRWTLEPDTEGASRLHAALKDGDAPQAELRFKPGEVQLTLESLGHPPEPAWVAVEEEGWSDRAATAAFVTTLQDFRDLFSSEALSPDEEVSIRSVAILFTDIKGSTALYERVGDARAYGLVREHFDILKECVRECRGGIVKTIGDAIMASFLSAEDAADAAFMIQERFAKYNRDRPKGKEKIVVKVGAHLGPAIVVSNGLGLDYFGTTVNIAARVQSESVGGDIVLSRSMMDAAKPALDRRRCRIEQFDIALKGLSGQFTLWRLRQDSPAGS